jgi:hypothetical protein
MGMGSHLKLPLTQTLSPLAGRGRDPSRSDGRVRGSSTTVLGWDQP